MSEIIFLFSLFFKIGAFSFGGGLAMLPIIGIGAWLGIGIVKMFPEKAFRRFIQIITILSVIMMLV